MAEIFNWANRIWDFFVVLWAFDKFPRTGLFQLLLTGFLDDYFICSVSGRAPDLALTSHRTDTLGKIREADNLRPCSSFTFVAGLPTKSSFSSFKLLPITSNLHLADIRSCTDEVGRLIA